LVIDPTGTGAVAVIGVPLPTRVTPWVQVHVSPSWYTANCAPGTACAVTNSCR
jgi:hypothetical protein